VFHAHPVRSAPGGHEQEEETEEISNGGGGGNKLVNSKSPTTPFIYLLGEGSWAEMWRKDQKR
jgi:hypothetical protein